jgi:choline dehydrogenase-like flavoprotein
MSFLGIRGVQDVKLAHLTSMVRHPYILWRIAHQKIALCDRSRYRDLFFMTEQLPNPYSRVFLSTSQCDKFGYPIASVDWRLSADDISMFGKYHKLLIDSFRGNEDVRKMRADSMDHWWETAASAAHHLGTARMSASIKNGVVDPNLKVFGLDNVWVSDGSVFPTAGSVNPSLTICALGHRLGTHLTSYTGASTASSGAAISYG